MKYFHYVVDSENTQIESAYSANNNPKFSMQCLAKIKQGIYKIWDSETNEVVTVPELAIVPNN